MSTTVQNIIDRVQFITADSDTSLRRWSDTELMLWASDGQRVMSTLKPDICSRISVIELVAGTRQSLPTDGITLISVIRNMGRSGETPGRAIRLSKREIMDAQNPDWHSEPKTLEVRNYIYDPMDQNNFYVYPPSNGQGSVEVHHNFSPAVITTTADVLSIPDNYVTALLDYVLWRAYSKDSDFAAGAQVANSYLNSFMMLMGAGESSEKNANPNNRLAAFDLNTKQRAQ